MELYLLNSDFSYASAPIDDYLSMTWRDRYSEAGDFSLTLSPEMARDAMNAAYVMNSERGIMEITGVTYSAVGKRQLTVTGIGLLGLLNRRIISAETSFNNTVGRIIGDRVYAEIRTASRAFPLPMVFSMGGAPDVVDETCHYGENLYDWTVNLLHRTKCGAEVTLDRDNNRLIMRIYKGLDRTSGQTVNSAAIFSQSFENIRELEVKKSVLDYKNVCIAFTGAAFYTRDGRHGTEDRRETFISVGDIATDAMWAECDDALANTMKVDSVSGAADQSDLVYRRDYNVGDLCTFSDSFTGLSGDARINEVTTIYENGAERVITSFGNQFISLREYIKRNSSPRVTYITAPESSSSDDE